MLLSIPVTLSFESGEPPFEFIIVEFVAIPRLGEELMYKGKTYLVHHVRWHVLGREHGRQAVHITLV
jgi:hypothetical protein